MSGMHCMYWNGLPWRRGWCPYSKHQTSEVYMEFPSVSRALRTRNFHSKSRCVWIGPQSGTYLPARNQSRSALCCSVVTAHSINVVSTVCNVSLHFISFTVCLLCLICKRVSVGILQRQTLIKNATEAYVSHCGLFYAYYYTEHVRLKVCCVPRHTLLWPTVYMF